MNNLIIRLYSKKDKNMVEALVFGEVMDLDYEYECDGEDLYGYSFDEEPFFTFVAERDGRIIGSITCYYSEISEYDIHQTNIEIVGIHVLEEYQKMGIATALFNEIKRKAKNEQINFITFEDYDYWRDTFIEKICQGWGMRDYSNNHHMKCLVTPYGGKDYNQMIRYLEKVEERTKLNKLEKEKAMKQAIFGHKAAR